MKTSKKLFYVESANQASTYVHQVSRWFRGRGLKSSHSIQRAANMLGITNNLAIRLYYRINITSFAPSRLRQMEDNYLAAIDIEIAQMEEQIARLRVVKAELVATRRTAPCSDSYSMASSKSANAVIPQPSFAAI